ncbi:hypothetical protein QJ854_gp126 [Moumouvirus goulette]|uniref:Uncharacterized protein n=1 Tax=Moumouvirus goulette TaxID=1247379 RepID=M1PNQ3_9VIRU|nr:hypothetical protein QJ854_gp126 [Moumouvirus goulette]AGF85656.1 hypothetical protein glt_00851 [Moumouvirus goulette]
MPFKICIYKLVSNKLKINPDCPIENNGVEIIDESYGYLTNAIMKMFNVILSYKFPNINERIDKPINMNCINYIGIFETNQNNNTLRRVNLTRNDFPKYVFPMDEKIIEIYLKSCDENLANLCLKMFGDNPYEFIVDERCKMFIKQCVEDFNKIDIDMENFEFNMEYFVDLIPGVHCVEYYERVLTTYVIENLEKEILRLGFYSKIRLVVGLEGMRLYFSYIVEKKLVDSHLYILNKKFETLEEDESKRYIMSKYCELNDIEIYSSVYKSLSQIIQ